MVFLPENALPHPDLITNLDELFTQKFWGGEVTYDFDDQAEIVHCINKRGQNVTVMRLGLDAQAQYEAERAEDSYVLRYVIALRAEFAPFDATEAKLFDLKVVLSKHKDTDDIIASAFTDQGAVLGTISKTGQVEDWLSGITA